MDQQAMCCLQSPSYRTELCDAFSDIIRNEELVDVTLSCEDGLVHSNRIILASASGYFRTLFANLTNKNLNNHHHPVIVLKDTTTESLKYVLDFVYSGKVNVPTSKVQRVRDCAQTLGVTGILAADVIASTEIVPHVRASAVVQKKKKRRRSKRSDGKTDEHSSDDTSDSNCEITSLPTSSVVSHMPVFEPVNMLEQSMWTANDQLQGSTNYTSLLFDASQVIGVGGPENLPLAYSKADNRLNTSAFDPVVGGHSSRSTSVAQHAGSSQTQGKCNFECQYCFKRFDVRYSLVRHIKVLHNPNVGHVCTGCGRRFTWKSAYLRHKSSVCSNSRKRVIPSKQKV